MIAIDRYSTGTHLINDVQFERRLSAPRQLRPVLRPAGVARRHDGVMQREVIVAGATVVLV